DNILKRLLIHAFGFNLALLVRSQYGIGKPRTLQGTSSPLLMLQIAVIVLCAGWAESVFSGAEHRR
ncbi:MAG: hypothetical protein ABSF98_29625, partial [Bryobacteraceae bacterium]